jgi:hypothetical protein
VKYATDSNDAEARIDQLKYGPKPSSYQSAFELTFLAKGIQVFWQAVINALYVQFGQQLKLMRNLVQALVRSLEV